MKRIFVLTLALLLLFSACKKTPEAEIVIQKDMDAMLEKARETPEAMPSAKAEPAQISPLYAALGAPEEYAPAIETNIDKLTIAVNARVMLPNAPGLPVARVAPSQFSQETVSALFRAFSGDTTLYDTTPSGMTKAQLEENILFYTNRVNEHTGSEKETARARLAFMQAELEALPKDVSDMVSDGTLREMVFSTFKPDVGRYMGVSAVEKPYAAFRESVGMVFLVHNDFDTMDYSDETVDWGEEIGAQMSWSKGRLEHAGEHGYTTYSQYLYDESAVPQNAAQELNITPAQARSLAEEAVAKAGLELICSGVYLKTFDYSDGEEYAAPPPMHVYLVTFGMSINGIPCRTVTEAEANNFKSETSLTPSWFYERITCTVTDDGVLSFSWCAPMQVREIVTQSANLLPFAKIAEIAEKMLPIVYGSGDGDLLSRTLTIDRAALELQRVTEQDAVEYGVVVPVWNFYGTDVAEYTFGSIENSQRELPCSLLTINAVDGSIVDVHAGY